MKMLLQSIFDYGYLKKDTHILIYTSTEFKEKIEQLNLFKKHSSVVFFHTNDEYNSVDSACKARLDLFEIPMVKDYSKILYLDTDILIMKNINKVFDVIQENKIYAMEEGSIDWYTDYWGYSLFGDEVNNYDDKTAFSSGVMGFPNCPEIENLFQTIKEHIQRDNRHFECYDQPYIVYNAKTSGLLDNKKFNAYVVGNSPYGNATEHDIRTNKTIVHFCGNAGVSNHKYVDMKHFLEKYQNYLKNLNSPHLFHQMKTDITDFIQNSNCINKSEIVEFGSNKGMVTQYLSDIFDKVYAVDKPENHQYNQDFNTDKTNIVYKDFSIYRDNWDVLRNDNISAVFIDFINSKVSNLFMIFNSIATFTNLQYLIFHGCSNALLNSLINECIDKNYFVLEKKIGNTIQTQSGEQTEGVIVSINPIFKMIQNRCYSWKHDCVNINGHIRFTKTFVENAFASNGSYTILSKNIIKADFSNEEHFLVFNDDLTMFKSIRKCDMHTSSGELHR
jgi:lipopolysaccharide biosynthesis glycosyltransferase